MLLLSHQTCRLQTHYNTNANSTLSITLKCVMLLDPSNSWLNSIIANTSCPSFTLSRSHTRARPPSAENHAHRSGRGRLIGLQLSEQRTPTLKFPAAEFVLLRAGLLLHIQHSNCNSSGKDLLSRFIWASSSRMPSLMRTASPQCITFWCCSVVSQR